MIDGYRGNSVAGDCERILVVTPVGLEGRGGIDRLNRYMADFFRDRADAPHLTFLGSRGEARAAFWLFYFGFALLRFAALVLGGGFDLVHIHVSSRSSAVRKCMFGLIARVLRQPYVIHFHADLKPLVCDRPPLWVRALGVLARGAQYCIVLGQPYAPAFRELLKVPAERVRIVHNGIPDIGADAVIPRPRRGAVRLVFSGEVGLRKGADLLLGALAALEAEHSEWSCTIAGNGDLEPWKEMARQNGLLDKVRFTGWLAIEAVHDLMREADIVVLPSRAEALPLALIEGASAGAALVACNVGAVGEIVADGVNGKIVRHDSDDIAKALGALIADRGMLAQMQIASRAIFEQRFHMSRFVAALRAVHHDALSPGGDHKAVASAAE